MKQLWLMKPPPAPRESTLALELDSRTHDQLVASMAAAIESLHGQQYQSSQQAKEAFADEQYTIAPQD